MEGKNHFKYKVLQAIKTWRWEWGQHCCTDVSLCFDEGVTLKDAPTQHLFLVVVSGWHGLPQGFTQDLVSAMFTLVHQMLWVINQWDLAAFVGYFWQESCTLNEPTSPCTCADGTIAWEIYLNNANNFTAVFFWEAQGPSPPPAYHKYHQPSQTQSSNLFMP